MISDAALVESFLIHLKAKIPIYGIIYESREKNIQTLLNLGIIPRQRDEYIETLTFRNYVSGPHKDEFEGTPLWVFGRIIQAKEIYIKIQINTVNKPVICISFHFAAHPLTYPLK